LEALKTSSFLVGLFTHFKPKNIPARDPNQCGGSKGVMHYNVDDVNVDDDGHDDGDVDIDDDDDDDGGDDDGDETADNDCDDDDDDDDDDDHDDDDDDDGDDNDDNDDDNDDNDDDDDGWMMMMMMVVVVMMMMMMMMMMWMWMWMMWTREPAQPKYKLTFHKGHFVWKFTGPAAYANPATPVFVRASLRSRNAHGHVTRAILYGNLQGKCRTPRIPPRLNTGP